METRRVREVLLGIGASATAMGALALAGCGNNTHSTEVVGSVQCATGRDVEGVWVAADKSKSGWAEWAAEANRHDAAAFSFKLDKGGKYSIHVGCGGSPSDWASSTWSDAFSSQEQHAFICHDSETRPASEPLLACEPIPNPPETHTTTSPASLA